MDVVFIRHGSAEAAGAGGDKARLLTAEGQAESRATGEGLGRLGVKLQRVLTSPLVRAVQTAGIVAKAHDGAPVEQTPMLAPPADAQAVRSRLAQLLAEGLDAVGLVGHAPSLDECVGVLVAARPKIGLSLSKAGAACVRLPDDWPDAMPEIRWVLRREQLALLAV